jgi:hypothetical protein
MPQLKLRSSKEETLNQLSWKQWKLNRQRLVLLGMAIGLGYFYNTGDENGASETVFNRVAEFASTAAVIAISVAKTVVVSWI